MKWSILAVSILFLNIAHGFRVNSNKVQNHNTHQPYSTNRNRPVYLFDSCQKSLSRCPVYNCLYSKVSLLNKKVNELVPGGWLTTLSVPLASYAVYKWYLKRKPSHERGSGTLHRYQCTSCGYVLFPARNREDRFFSESFTCPNCGAPRSKFTEKFK